jgi:hypothetical protein
LAEQLERIPFELTHYFSVMCGNAVKRAQTA